MSEELKPINPHETTATHLQWADLEADPLTVNRSEFSPVENIAFDYVDWIGQAIDEANRNSSEDAPLEASYHNVGTPSFLKPDSLNFSINRGVNGANSDIVFFEVEMIFPSGPQDISLAFITDKLPSLTDDQEDKEEVLQDFELDYHVGSESVGFLGSHEEPDQEQLELFRNTLDGLKSLMAKDYIPLSPER